MIIAFHKNIFDKIKDLISKKQQENFKSESLPTIIDDLMLKQLENFKSESLPTIIDDLMLKQLENFKSESLPIIIENLIPKLENFKYGSLHNIDNAESSVLFNKNLCSSDSTFYNYMTPFLLTLLLVFFIKYMFFPKNVIMFNNTNIEENNEQEDATHDNIQADQEENNEQEDATHDNIQADQEENNEQEDATHDNIQADQEENNEQEDATHDNIQADQEENNEPVINQESARQENIIIIKEIIKVFVFVIVPSFGFIHILHYLCDIY